VGVNWDTTPDKVRNLGWVVDPIGSAVCPECSEPLTAVKDDMKLRNKIKDLEHLINGYRKMIDSINKDLATTELFDGSRDTTHGQVTILVNSYNTLRDNNNNLKKYTQELKETNDGLAHCVHGIKLICDTVIPDEALDAYEKYRAAKAEGERSNEK
jgi:hypothetical protein